MVKEAPAAEAKQKVKDSVFTHLFSEPEYLLELYQALHHEDCTVKEKDLKIVTIKNILVDQWYNDLGFIVRDLLIVLVECQSTWSLNIVLRLFLYLAHTYQQYITENQINVHSRTKINLPKPELYVIYTGKRRKNMPGKISLAEKFFGGDKSVLDVKVKVIYDGKKGDIINQYCTFTKVLMEQIGKHGRTREAIMKTIHICEDKNVLKKFLESREKEVVNIMMTLFSQEYADRVKKRELEEKGRKKGRKEGNMEAAYKFYKSGTPVENISELLDIPIKDLQKWFKRIEKQEKEPLD